MRQAIACLTAALLVTFAAAAQPVAPMPADANTLEGYLWLLERLHPAVRTGADAYAAAFRERCGRSVTHLEMRQALSEGGGDPTLKAMIRAALEREPGAASRLAPQLRCPKG